MIDVNEKERVKVASLIERLDRFGDAELKNKANTEDFLSSETYRQSVQLGLIAPPPDEFRSKYKILKEFLMTKKFEGCSSQTLRVYYDTLFNFIVSIGEDKSVFEIRTPDIRSYLLNYQETHKVSNTTLDNMRRVFSSFFNWLETEDYALKNPVNKIKRIKTDKIIKKPFTPEELESIRDACRNYRDLALIEFLYSSGIRVGELCGLDITDLNFNTREVIVFGKGSKERLVYFSAQAKVHLKRYISTRVDTNPALFVTRKYPYNRLEKSGVEVIIRKIGLKAGVEHCHPHRFRRTFATSLLDKGVPIEQVQLLLGHSKIDTTLIYATVNRENVKLNHSRFM